MFSVQSHNQVLYHLAQLTSIFNTKSAPLPVKIKRKNEFKNSVDDVSCNSSVEVANSYIGTLINTLNMHDVITILNIKRNNVSLILDRISMKVFKTKLEENNKWNVSYVCGSNFSENKQGFPCAQLTEPIILPSVHLSLKQHHRTCTLCVKNPFNYHVQIRSFKTNRNVEFEKRPSYMRRFKKFFFDLNTDTHLKEADVEKINSVIKDSSAEGNTRINKAFIEGYEAGLQRQIRTRSVWQKGISNLFLGSLILLTIWLSVYYRDNMFRLSMNTKSEINPEEIHVTFDDVKGVDAAKQELKDVVEFLKNPERFSALGGKLPKGILLVGPPGTGKTLLARAVAGEAGVPFFHVAGPEFDEVLVGQGARRVRDLFRAAEARAPAVIFIDEIDSVGAKRTNSVLHPYANQTVNQLLSEMDGFVQNEGVIVLGATNRRDDLDKALLRPGRFDVQIHVQMPTYMDRKEILDLYLSKILARDIDVDCLARMTSGFTGADIETMVNQAALRAAINNGNCVTMKDMEEARDKILLGPEGRGRIQDDETNRITAYHEAGHALVAYYTRDSRPVHKITIIPRGHALGFTRFLPDKDEYYFTKAQLLSAMDVCMGGRVGEELIFGPDKVTTGAANDFSTATSIAEKMVKSYGMSEKVGYRLHKDGNIQENSNYGTGIGDILDAEVNRLMKESYERAKTILKNHAKEHKALAEALLIYETLDGEDLKRIINGQNIRNETSNKQPSPPIVDPSKLVL